MEMTEAQRLQRRIAGLKSAQKLGPEGRSRRAQKGGNTCFENNGSGFYKLLRAEQLLNAAKAKQSETRRSGRASQVNQKED